MTVMRPATPIAPAPAPAAPLETRPPPSRPGTVPRARLVRRLIACRDVPLVTVVAPAGYGKSTLLAEWAGRDDRPFAWLSPARDGDELAALELAERAARQSAPQVIVLDDVHGADPETVRRLVDVACRFPPGAVLALASRGRLPLAAGRLRAHHLMPEIGAPALAMNRLEAAMLLDAAGLRLDGGQVDLLLQRTEGWPAALYLAALSTAEQPSVAEAVAAFSGADRLVAEYLDGEPLAGLGDDEREFLRRTSVLDRLTGPLCDALLDRAGSAELLVRLRRLGVPIEPLDRCDLTFRYHRLLADALGAELARLEPEQRPLLHRRAADWHALHDDDERALRHAVACRDAERAGKLLWSLAPRYAGDGRARLLGMWLEPFRERELAAHPELALTAATYHLAEGRRDHAERALDTAERRLPDAPGVAMLRACIARRGAGRMGEDAARACALAPPDSPWQSLGLLLQGVSRHLAGERDAAGALLEAGEHRASGCRPVVSALCRAQLALLAVEAGGWEDAERHVEQATLADAAPSGARALVRAVSAVVATQRGDLAPARQDAAEAQRLLASRAEFAPWLVAETQAWLARAMIRLSDGPAARTLLSRAARVQAGVLDAPVLLAWVHEGWELADAFAESATGDGPTLTNAELRILRLLPSHLTLREIGERLNVSTNTVKTQSMAVYRKLDVSSRSNAVARGRAAGLIDGV